MTRLCLLGTIVIAGMVAGLDGSRSSPSADELVKVESARTGLYDYETAWKWALSISKAERASRFADIVNANNR